MILTRGEDTLKQPDEVNNAVFPIPVSLKPASVWLLCGQLKRGNTAEPISSAQPYS